MSKWGWYLCPAAVLAMAVSSSCHGSRPTPAAGNRGAGRIRGGCRLGGAGGGGFRPGGPGSLMLCIRCGPALRLRGGRREGRRICCPGTEYTTVRAGLEAACKGDVAAVGRGEHHMTRSVCIGNRTLVIEGDPAGGSCVVGKWVLREGSRGSVSGLGLVLDWRGDGMDWAEECVPGEEDQTLHSFTVLVRGGQWSFDRCRIEASSSPGGGESAIMVAPGGNVSVSSSHIGGQGHGAARVECGLAVSGDAVVSLDGCGVSLCSSFGFRVHDTARVHVTGGSVDRCRVGLMLGDEVEVRMKGVHVAGGQGGAAFHVEERARYTAKLFLTETIVEGQRWLYGAMPCKHSSDPLEQQGLEEDEWSDTHAHSTYRERFGEWDSSASADEQSIS